MTAWLRAALELTLAGLGSSVLAFAALLLVATADGVAAGRSWQGILVGLGLGWRLAGPLALALGLAAVAGQWRGRGWLLALEIGGRSPRRWLAVAAAVAFVLAPWTAAVEAYCGASEPEWRISAGFVAAPDGRTVDLETLAVARGAPPAVSAPGVLGPTVLVQVPAAIVLVAAAIEGGPVFFAVLAATVAAVALVRGDGSPVGTAALAIASAGAALWTGRRSRPPG